MKAELERDHCRLLVDKLSQISEAIRHCLCRERRRIGKSLASAVLRKRVHGRNHKNYYVKGRKLTKLLVTADLRLK